MHTGAFPIPSLSGLRSARLSAGGTCYGTHENIQEQGELVTKIGRSVKVVWICSLVGVLGLPVMTVAQDGLRTGWGDPDLQGVWDFRTITPLQRPEDLGDKAFLTEEEAANLEQEAAERDTRLLN